jgi:TIR domain
MSSLADLPEIVGFFSYSREDDEAFEGTLSALRGAIQRELSAQLGRSKTTFRLWQDQEAIAPGKLWKSEIKTAVEQSVFFIPVVTPRAVKSHYCKFEFEVFLSREQELGRADLVFPLLYIRVPALESEAQWRTDPVLTIVGMRQYVDWRPFRQLDVRDTTVRVAIERFCDKIVEALREPWVSPEERQKQQEIEAARQAEEQRQGGAARPAEEVKRLAEAARQAEETTRLIEQKRRLKYSTQNFIEKVTNDTVNIKKSTELLHFFRTNFSDAALMLRDQLKDWGAESVLTKTTYNAPQTKSDIDDIIAELEFMARRL